MGSPPAPLAPLEPDDFALMASLRTGAPGAFDRLATRWRPRLVNFLRSLGADPEAAEDGAQETLLRVYRYRDAYRPDVPFAGFVFTLARRAFLDGRRRARRHERHTSAVPLDDPGVVPAVAPEDDGCAERIDLAVAVASLPRRLRDVVELAVLRGLPYPQVSTLLGIPVGTVKSRMHHAVRRLREVLGDGAAPDPAL